MYTPEILNGNYRDRQRRANELNALFYYEQHFNSVGGPAAQTADYACSVVASNASQTSKAVGRDLAVRWATALGTRVGGGARGLIVGGRGEGNLRYTAMPAVIGEPLFVSNPGQAELVRTPETQHAIAKVVANVIREWFDKPGIIALSVGHKGKVPDLDRGAKVYGGGFEAHYAEQVIQQIAVMLQGVECR